MGADSRTTRRNWAYETFSDLDVGSRARTARVVAVATALAARPAGTVTEVVDTSAEREGAYRLLSNDAVSSRSLGEAVFGATVARCSREKRVFVAVDGSSLTLTDRCHARDVGGVGAGARGLIVRTGLAIAADGPVRGVWLDVLRTADTAILLKKGRTKYRRGSQPPLGDMVRMVADLGGYTGRSSGGPPGPTVLARGLERVAVAAEILELLAT